MIHHSKLDEFMVTAKLEEREMSQHIRAMLWRLHVAHACGNRVRKLACARCTRRLGGADLNVPTRSLQASAMLLVLSSRLIASDIKSLTCSKAQRPQLLGWQASLGGDAADYF